MGIAGVRWQWDGPVAARRDAVSRRRRLELIDRLVDGRVVDFLNLGVGPLRTGIVNVADVAIMTGLTLLVWAQWIGESRQLPE